MTSNIPSRILISLIFTQIAMLIIITRGAAGQKSGGGGGPPEQSMERALTERIKAAGPDKLRRGKAQAARKLQANLARAMGIVAKSKQGGAVPVAVRNSAKRIVGAVRTGQLNRAAVLCLPYIMTHVHAGTLPGAQLETVVINLLPHAPANLKSPLGAILQFVQANLNGVNVLLGGTLQGTTDLLQGVTTALVGTLGGVNQALTGSLDSLNNLVGSLLCCSRSAAAQDLA